MMSKSAQSFKEHEAEYKKNNRSVYDILDQMCKDIDLYPYVKQHDSKRDNRWLAPNHLNTLTSEAMSGLLMSTYDGEKKAWNWEKCVT